MIIYKTLYNLEKNNFDYSDNCVLKLSYFIINKTVQIKKELMSRLKSKVRENYQTNDNNTDFFRTMTEELNVINSIVSFKTKEYYIINPPTNLKQLSGLYTDSYNNLTKSLGDNIKRKIIIK